MREGLLIALLLAFILGSLLTRTTEAQGSNVTMWGTTSTGTAVQVLTDTSGHVLAVGQ